MTETQRAATVRIPWWLRLLFAAACIVVGALLVGVPLGNLPALRWLVAAALALTGLAGSTGAEVRGCRIISGCSNDHERSTRTARSESSL